MAAIILQGDQHWVIRHCMGKLVNDPDCISKRDRGCCSTTMHDYWAIPPTVIAV